jgi:hypothetical protein
VDAPLQGPDALIRPWKRATILASLIAAIELVVLLIAGVALLAKPVAHMVQRQAEVRAFTPVHPAAAKHVAAPKVEQTPKRARSQVHVLVLNGNGRHGAAATAASRLSVHGYPIAGTANAPRGDYATTVVMYRNGYRLEAVRLAHDMHIKVVGPIDGLRPKQLMGAQVAVLLGHG